MRERERERERERDTETDGSDLTLVALKLATSIALFLAEICTLLLAKSFALSLPKICTLVSPLLNGADFTLSVVKDFALFETVSILRKILTPRFTSVKWRDRGSKHRNKWSNFRLHRPPSHRKMNQIQGYF